MLYKVILGALFVEAVTQLIFTAAPLQSIKLWIRTHTPFLYSADRDEHLLDCKYCTSVWVAAFSVVLYFALYPNIMLTILFYSCIVHRMSNYMHTVYSYLVDKQIDLRIARGKR